MGPSGLLRLLWTLAATVTLALLVARVQSKTPGDDFLPRCDQKPCSHLGQCVVDEVTCDEGYILTEGGSVCGCCPGCLKPLKVGEECSDTLGPCPHGTSCKEDEKNPKRNICTIGPCAAEMGHELWTPSCERDGSFSAVQCKGNPGSGRCFCWSPDGDRLDGQRSWEHSTNMSCACSVRAWELTRAKRVEDVPRCADDGAFEALQCARGVCWCADPYTGDPRGRTVPETAMAVLACYEAAQVGDTYRRRCDSQLEARLRIQELLAAHGTSAHGLPPVDCDLDGSFAPVQQRDNHYICAWKNKEQIHPYESTTNEGMNCKCARDTIYLSNPSLDCQGNGNHKAEQKEDEQSFCVDDDGYFKFFVTDTRECYI